MRYSAPKVEPRSAELLVRRHPPTSPVQGDSVRRVSKSAIPHPDEGKRVRLVRCLDEHQGLAAGDTGVVEYVDANGTRHVRWDDGSQLGLVSGIDEWEEITAPDASLPPTLRDRPKG
jgi:hypothetical protein